MPVDSQTFKQVMSQWPSGVTVITSIHEGQRVGITASSFSSVSMEPPLISVCISKRLYTHELIAKSGIFAVNILTAQQVELGKLFAGYYKDIEDRFAGIGCRTEITGAPILPDTLAWLDCKVHHAYEGGDHTIYVGEVLSGGTLNTITPLLYHNRAWGQFTRQLPPFVEIVEVGLRDGLQNEEILVPTEMKCDIVESLVDAGLKRIQVASFVNPARVPQMADAEAVCAGLKPHDGIVYSGLVLNMKGLERLHTAGLKHVDMGISVSSAHSLKNIGKSTDDAFIEFTQMVQRARGMGLIVRGAIQCAFGCVYEGVVSKERVLDFVKRFIELGVDEVALADSTGMANPIQIREMSDAALTLLGKTPLILHLHDTRGMGLANMLSAMQSGVSHFDSAFGGLGGCPFIEGATGNIATEDTLNMLHAMGISTGISTIKVARISQRIAALMGKTLPGKLYRFEESDFNTIAN